MSHGISPGRLRFVYMHSVHPAAHFDVRENDLSVTSGLHPPALLWRVAKNDPCDVKICEYLVDESFTDELLGSFSQVPRPQY